MFTYIFSDISKLSFLAPFVLQKTQMLCFAQTLLETKKHFISNLVGSYGTQASCSYL